MDYEKEDLDHSLVPIYCPACGRGTNVFACDLKANPQTVCLNCGCIYLVEVEERKEGIHGFWEKVKKAKAEL